MMHCDWFELFFFFFLTRKCFAIKHLSKHIFCVHYVVLWASCLKMITKKYCLIIHDVIVIMYGGSHWKRGIGIVRYCLE